MQIPSCRIFTIQFIFLRIRRRKEYLTMRNHPKMVPVSQISVFMQCFGHFQFIKGIWHCISCQSLSRYK
jgi:hypothetical protein